MGSHSTVAHVLPPQVHRHTAPSALLPPEEEQGGRKEGGREEGGREGGRREGRRVRLEGWREGGMEGWREGGRGMRREER